MSNRRNIVRARAFTLIELLVVIAIIANNLHWDNTLHGNAGNMVMADGSAHQFTQAGLVDAMATSGDTRNCALKPN